MRQQAAFQSTFPHGERPLSTPRLYTEYEFQSTFPHGERRSLYVYRAVWSCFNPRSRTGNDTCICLSCITISWFQSTFPHGERRLTALRGEFPVGVSIHVPARGTTNQYIYSPKSVSRFQSTFPHGERRYFFDCICLIQRVSIHVPARGTTDVRSAFHIMNYMFQSTFPHGERQQSSTNFLCAFCSYLCNYTNKFRSTQPPARFSSHFTSKSRCESPWNSMFTPDSHHSVIALLFIRNHQNIHCTTS